MTNPYGYPEKRGLYDPQFEHDACGVGFIANIKGVRSHQMVRDASTMLIAMDHRGACGCEPNTGDGAGMMTALPHQFLQKVAKDDLAVDLPSPGKFAAGIVFLPQDKGERETCKETVNKIIAEQGQRLVGWRVVPTDAKLADVGQTALVSEPHMEQLFIAAGEGCSGDAFERQVYIIRKRASHALRSDTSLRQAKMFYVCSLSTKVIIYKGMLTSEQLLQYYPDLRDDDYTSHLAMVHSRFSTNTFPSWDRAQPCRFMSHNGEINTLRGNKNWMHAREGVVRSDLFGEELEKLFPIVEPDCSDSGTFDNALEFLLMTGRSLQEAVMMMIPEAWQKHETMSEAKRAFYEYHSCLMEPWDGPASVAFTDGKYIGAVLDRNGLRPSRYYLTHDDRVIMASEVGVLPVDPKIVKEKGRLQPGKIFLIDFEQGRMVPDDEVKGQFALRRPYADWLRSRRIELADLKPNTEPHGFDAETLLPRMQAFGYTSETMQFMLIPMIQQARDPVGSMGNDSALACLSDQPRMLYDYFKQLFAQVTNPAIDSIREEIIMSLECYIGPERNLLETTEDHANRLLVPHPILTNEELAAIKHMDGQFSGRHWKTKTIDITFERPQSIPPERQAEKQHMEHVADGFRELLVASLDRICHEAEAAIDEGYTLIVLSDRNVGPGRVAVSSLLACGAVHHHLIRQIKRTRIGIVLETGEAREVHHHCLLAGYGADAINPYLAFESLWQARRDELVDAATFPDDDAIVLAYRKAVAKGMLKVFGKMGISTLQSYKGAQIFEALGLRDQVVDRCFVGTASRVQGVNFSVLAKETLRRHALGYPEDENDRLKALPNPGEFHWRSAGERHAWSPEAIADLQVAARTDSREAYKRFAKHINDRCAEPQLIAWTVQVQGRRTLACAAGRSRTGQRDCQAVLHRRDEFRQHFGRGPRDAGHRHESPGRQEQHGRRRRRPGAVHSAPQRRFEADRHQAGGLRPLRCDDLVSDQRRRVADQDFARGQAGRRGRTAGAKGRRQHRPHPLQYAGCGAD